MSAAMRFLGPIPALILVGLALSAGLVGAAVHHVRAVAAGTEILLLTEGFDPRGLLRGHYAEVRYRINSASAVPSEINNSVAFERGFVTIVPADGDWAVVAVTRARPSSVPAGGHAIAAKVRGSAEPSGYLDILYGIERVYAQQSEAEALERTLRGPDEETGEVRMAVSLGAEGRLRLKGIVIDGERRDFTWW